MQKRKLVFWIAMFSSLILLIGCCALVTQTYTDYKKEMALQAADDYKSKTTPLSAEVVQDLCNKLDLPAQDWRCQPEAIVYAPEFFEDIKGYLRNLPRTSSNQAEVDELLGDYKIKCSTPQKYRYTSVAYDCLYDLHGDRVSIIVIYFTDNGTIDHYHASTGSS